MSHWLGPIQPLESLQQAGANGILCTEFAQPPNLVIPGHAHPSSILLFVLNGSVSERFGRNHLEYSSASVVLKPPGEVHAHHYGKVGVHCVAAEFGETFLSRYPDLEKLCSNIMHRRDGSLFAIGLRLWRQLQRCDTVTPLASEELILNALGHMMKMTSTESSSAPGWLRKARDIIDAQYLEPLSLASIANQVDVHPVYLADTFRKYYGCTVGNTIDRLRLDYAIQQMLQTERSFTDVALTAGFFD
ncbi:MAG: AraC family transcriptional regulator, partial [Nitrososphaera sp.]|nr:AraC family transcriptional regulator [Nitrososphaera sp.]